MILILVSGFPVNFFHSRSRAYYLWFYYLIFNYMCMRVFDRRFWVVMRVFDRSGMRVFDRG